MKPCAKPFCPELVERDQRFCKAHGGNSNWAGHQQKHGSTTDRGYGYKWQKLREKILRRDGYLCQECKRNGRLVSGREVDHVVPKSAGGKDHPGNLQTLCKPCHAVKSAGEGRGARG